MRRAPRACHRLPLGLARLGFLGQTDNSSGHLDTVVPVGCGVVWELGAGHSGGQDPDLDDNTPEYICGGKRGGLEGGLEGTAPHTACTAPRAPVSSITPTTRCTLALTRRRPRSCITRVRLHLFLPHSLRIDHRVMSHIITHLPPPRHHLTSPRSQSINNTTLLQQPTHTAQHAQHDGWHPPF